MSVTVQQIDLLIAMMDHHGFVEGEVLAEAMGISKGAVRARLNRLHGRELVDVQQRGRSLEWRINQEGRDTVRARVLAS